MPFCGRGKRGLVEDAGRHRTLKAAFASLGNMPPFQVREPAGEQSFHHPRPPRTQFAFLCLFADGAGVALLLYGHRFGEIPRLVHIAAAHHRDVISQ